MPQGRNIFQGRLSRPGQHRRVRPQRAAADRRFHQPADGTSWMAMYCAESDAHRAGTRAAQPVYEDIATKFFEHFLHIAEAINNVGDEGIGLWDDEDEFYYDVLNLPTAATSCRSRCVRWSG
jgi:hypothetical protein